MNEMWWMVKLQFGRNITNNNDSNLILKEVKDKGHQVICHKCELSRMKEWVSLLV